MPIKIGRTVASELTLPDPMRLLHQSTMWQQKKRHHNSSNAKCDTSEPNLKHPKFEQPSPMALTSDKVHDALSKSSNVDECFDISTVAPHP